MRLSRVLPPACENTQESYRPNGLLRAEGFTDVRYVGKERAAVDSSVWLARGELDFDWELCSDAPRLDQKTAFYPITVLAGLHSGCLELIANDSVRTSADLRGKKVGVLRPRFGPTRPLVTLWGWLPTSASIPKRDIEWKVMNYDATSMQPLHRLGQDRRLPRRAA